LARFKRDNYIYLKKKSTSYLFFIWRWLFSLGMVESSHREVGYAKRNEGKLALASSSFISLDYYLAKPWSRDGKLRRRSYSKKELSVKYNIFI